MLYVEQISISWSTHVELGPEVYPYNFGVYLQVLFSEVFFVKKNIFVISYFSGKYS